ncbi:hypothetical protein [Cupriavidus sp. M-11]|uniref:hypothetical protein n=1 Tax=Cupriavidus sp. M-11 TaxID=3233038 RepID=UPI003F9135C2
MSIAGIKEPGIFGVKEPGAVACIGLEQGLRKAVFLPFSMVDLRCSGMAPGRATGTVTQAVERGSPQDLVASEGVYLAKRLENESVSAFLRQRQPDLLAEFELIVQTVSLDQ